MCKLPVRVTVLTRGSVAAVCVSSVLSSSSSSSFWIRVRSCMLKLRSFSDNTPWPCSSITQKTQILQLRNLIQGTSRLYCSCTYDNKVLCTVWIKDKCVLNSDPALHLAKNIEMFLSQLHTICKRKIINLLFPIAPSDSSNTNFYAGPVGQNFTYSEYISIGPTTKRYILLLAMLIFLTNVQNVYFY